MDYNLCAKCEELYPPDHPDFDMTGVKKGYSCNMGLFLLERDSARKCGNTFKYTRRIGAEKYIN